MRLLLAEDEKELSDALVNILRHNHFSVDAAYDGQEALDYLEGEIYDGVLLDIMMPKVDGITVLKELRRRGNKVPVLMLTAKSEVDDRVLGLDSGADDYLTKPFAMKELLARVRAMTRRQAQMTDNILTMGNLSLNRADFTLAVGERSYCLANKEYQMMEMLLVNRGQLISGERFMEKIWGYDTESEINVVWVYISCLRKKLAALEADIRIKAVRGAGYMLERIE